ncbi:uncharacterized protein BDZ99DRAFT_389599 [Mytilinidion resinicola]|uniref:Zn(2)-C6 fungal-type domain-containing protein n=1 Tax=Mytilinidion resinicola TaxID=574789 RepID=A0A6A6YIL7_9PEZI|nr:uncharacterized protein BDZ99DRAFT_389599 [Mytilinidion resinicola]KAF2808702.1 hypothetical protein BDZ99DRAFT_389599 [Mytilinidion resinicola]
MESGFGIAEAHRESVGSPGDGGQRRERASIAAQACETCRNRKSKCDERRPKCSLCHRLNVECKYREPQPTKKDKTMVNISDNITRVLEGQARIESKIDVLGRHVVPGSPVFRVPRSPTSASTVGQSSTLHLSSPFSMSGSIKPDVMSAFSPESATYSYMDNPMTQNILTAPHKILLWPAIAEYMTDRGVAGLDLQSIIRSGTPWILRHDLVKHPDVLSIRTPLIRVSTPQGVGFPDLNMEVMNKYTEAYFSNFNRLFPILDRKEFQEDFLARIVRNGFGDDLVSILVLLVLSLGVVADEGANGVPVRSNSGIRGGTSKEPPGLAIFNEARKRMGFVSTQCSVENIQCHLLSSEQVDWNSSKGVAVKRVYWMCHLIENWFHLDLDLPQTGLCNLQGEVPLPEDGDSNISDDMHYNMLHFTALEYLRKVIARIHSDISRGKSTNSRNEPSDETGSPPTHIINELKTQLDDWRHALPVALQWHDADRFAYPNHSGSRGVPGAQQVLFRFNQGTAESWRGNILDIITAQLRSRYYYAEFMVYRAFVFKALHHPNSMTHEDKEMAARCLRSALLWPIAMWPCKSRKRLVPVLFAWTQNFIGVLLVLRMLTVDKCLHDIMGHYLDQGEVEQTVMLLLDWMRDVKQIDGIAEWSWTFLERLYDDVVGKF